MDYVRGTRDKETLKEFDSEVFALEIYGCTFREFIPFLKILTNVVKTPWVRNVATFSKCTLYVTFMGEREREREREVQSSDT